MELEKAIHQISEIHGHLARSEIFRGYRSIPIGAAGVFALAAGWFQAAVAPPDWSFVAFWSVVGVLGAALSGGELAWQYAVNYGPADRRRTRQVLGQFVPAIGSAVLATLVLAGGPQALSPTGTDETALLPGLWSLFFAMGIFASRPYLPRTIGWIAAWYVVAGCALLASGMATGLPSGWGLAATFGVGQLFTALVLYWNIERRPWRER